MRRRELQTIRTLLEQEEHEAIRPDIRWRDVMRATRRMNGNLQALEEEAQDIATSSANFIDSADIIDLAETGGDAATEMSALLNLVLKDNVRLRGQSVPRRAMQLLRKNALEVVGPEDMEEVKTAFLLLWRLLNRYRRVRFRKENASAVLNRVQALAWIFASFFDDLTPLRTSGRISQSLQNLARDLHRITGNLLDPSQL